MRSEDIPESVKDGWGRVPDAIAIKRVHRNLLYTLIDSNEIVSCRAGGPKGPGTGPRMIYLPSIDDYFAREAARQAKEARQPQPIN